MLPVRRIALKVTFDNLNELVHTLYPNSTPTFKKCSDGITNILFHCKVNDQSFLIRIYGKKTEILIDREREVENFIKLSAAGLAPKLIAQFENGLVYQFIPGRILLVKELPVYASSIAHMLRKWHNLPTLKSSLLWETMARWLKLVPDTAIGRELEWLKEVCQAFNYPIVFSHNDLLHANVILDTDQSIHFIDYEYASPAELPFDIANHFCEYAGFECDYRAFPNETAQKAFIKEYYGDSATDKKVNELYDVVKWFCLASHMYWTLWAKVQAKISDIEFGYQKYADLRWSEYMRLKDELIQSWTYPNN